jgi:hypothetical protein
MVPLFVATKPDSGSSDSDASFSDSNRDQNLEIDLPLAGGSRLDSGEPDLGDVRAHKFPEAESRYQMYPLMHLITRTHDISDICEELEAEENFETFFATHNLMPIEFDSRASLEQIWMLFGGSYLEQHIEATMKDENFARCRSILFVFVTETLEKIFKSQDAFKVTRSIVELLNWKEKGVCTAQQHVLQELVETWKHSYPLSIFAFLSMCGNLFVSVDSHDDGMWFPELSPEAAGVFWDGVGWKRLFEGGSETLTRSALFLMIDIAAKKGIKPSALVKEELVPRGLCKFAGIIAETVARVGVDMLPVAWICGKPEESNVCTVLHDESPVSRALVHGRLNPWDSLGFADMAVFANSVSDSACQSNLFSLVFGAAWDLSSGVGPYRFAQSAEGLSHLCRTEEFKRHLLSSSPQLLRMVWMCGNDPELVCALDDITVSVAASFGTQIRNWISEGPIASSLEDIEGRSEECKRKILKLTLDTLDTVRLAESDRGFVAFQDVASNIAGKKVCDGFLGIMFKDIAGESHRDKTMHGVCPGMPRTLSFLQGLVLSIPRKPVSSVLEVRKEFAFTDSLSLLASVQIDFTKPSHVVLSSKSGEPTRMEVGRWLQLVISIAASTVSPDPNGGLFVYARERGYWVPNSEKLGSDVIDPQVLRAYMAFGKALGYVFVRKQTMPVVFPKYFYALLLQKPIELSDLSSEDETAVEQIKLRLDASVSEGTEPRLTVAEAMKGILPEFHETIVGAIRDGLATIVVLDSLRRAFRVGHFKLFMEQMGSGYKSLHFEGNQPSSRIQINHRKMITTCPDCRVKVDLSLPQDSLVNACALRTSGDIVQDRSAFTCPSALIGTSAATVNEVIVEYEEDESVREASVDCSDGGYVAFRNSGSIPSGLLLASESEGSEAVTGATTKTKLLMRALLRSPDLLNSLCKEGLPTDPDKVQTSDFSRRESSDPEIESLSEEELKLVISASVVGVDPDSVNVYRDGSVSADCKLGTTEKGSLWFSMLSARSPVVLETLDVPSKRRYNEEVARGICGDLRNHGERTLKALIEG